MLLQLEMLLLLLRRYISFLLRHICAVKIEYVARMVNFWFGSMLMLSQVLFVETKAKALPNHDGLSVRVKLCAGNCQHDIIFEQQNLSV